MLVSCLFLQIYHHVLVLFHEDLQLGFQPKFLICCFHLDQILYMRGFLSFLISLNTSHPKTDLSMSFNPDTL